MIVGMLVLGSLAVAATVGMRKLKPLLDRLEEDVKSDEHWRPL